MDLSNNELGSSDLIQLVNSIKVPNLQELNLSDNQLTNIIGIDELPNLRKLILTNNNIDSSPNILNEFNEQGPGVYVKP